MKKISWQAKADAIVAPFALWKGMDMKKLSWQLSWQAKADAMTGSCAEAMATMMPEDTFHLVLCCKSKERGDQIGVEICAKSNLDPYTRYAVLRGLMDIAASELLDKGEKLPEMAGPPVDLLADRRE